MVLSFLATPRAASATQFGMFGLWATADKPRTLAIFHESGYQLAIMNTYHLAAARKAHVRGIVAFSLTKKIADDNLLWKTFLADVKRAVVEHHKDPAVFAWYPVDEPELQGIPAEKVKHLVETIRAADSSRPIFVVVHDPDKWSKYLPFFDIVAEDKYLDKKQTSPAAIKDEIEQLKKDLARINPKAEAWAVLGALHLRPRRGGDNYHKPSPEEFRAMAKIAKQESVGGVLVYTCAFKNFELFLDWNLPAEDPALWNAVRTLPAVYDSL